MSGNVVGGKKAAQTNKDIYGEDFYKRIGAKGGAAAYNGKRGFAANRELASRAGRLGGLKSKRRPKEEVKYIKHSLWNAVKGRIKTHG